MTKFISIIFVLTGVVLGQNQKTVDSLSLELQRYEQVRRGEGSQALELKDTTRANLLFSLAKVQLYSNPDTVLSLAAQCLQLSTMLKYKRGEADAYVMYNLYYYMKGKLTSALDYAQKALIIRRELDDKPGIVFAVNRIGGAQEAIGFPGDAMTSFLESKNLAESIGDSLGIATSLNNLAGIYIMQGKKTKALECYAQSVAILHKNESREFARHKLFQAYQGMGNIYMGMPDRLHQSIEAHRTAMKYADVLNYKTAVATCIGNIGVVYRELQQLDTAMRYFKSAHVVIRMMKNPDYMSWILALIGETYDRLGKSEQALTTLYEALPYALASSQATTQGIYEDLALVYEKRHDYKRAFEFQKKSAVLKDSLAAHSNLDAVTQAQMKYEYGKHQDSLRVEQRKKDEIAASELQKQKLVRNSFIGGFGVVLLFAALFFRQRNKIKEGKKQSDALLLNILPAEVAEELKEKGHADAKHFDNVTVLFTDFKSFTTFSEQLSPQELVNELHACFKAFDEICERYSIEKIKTIGDAYLAVCGLPLPNERHAENVVRAAIEIRDFMLERRRSHGPSTFECRIGINSGSVVAGIVGVKKYSYDIWGDTVNTAARMEQNGEVGKINISESTCELVDGLFSLEYRGEINAKNKGKLKMYYVEEVS